MCSLPYVYNFRFKEQEQQVLVDRSYVFSYTIYLVFFPFTFLFDLVWWIFFRFSLANSVHVHLSSHHFILEFLDCHTEKIWNRRGKTKLCLFHASAFSTQQFCLLLIFNISIRLDQILLFLSGFPRMREFQLNSTCWNFHTIALHFTCYQRSKMICSFFIENNKSLSCKSTHTHNWVAHTLLHRVHICISGDCYLRNQTIMKRSAN